MEILSILLILQSVLLVTSGIPSTPLSNWIFFRPFNLFSGEFVRYSALNKLVDLVIVNFFILMNSGAERFNGLMAMLGVVAGIGAYATTGQIIPVIF